MTTDEKIDKLLKVFCERNAISIPFGEIYPLAFGEPSQWDDQLQKRMVDQETLKDQMTEFGLIERVSGVSFKISASGRQICESGGWIEYLKSKSNESKAKENKERMRFIIPNVISITAILVSIYLGNETVYLKHEINKIKNTIDSVKGQLKSRDELIEDHRIKSKELILKQDTLRKKK